MGINTDWNSILAALIFVIVPVLILYI